MPNDQPVLIRLSRAARHTDLCITTEMLRAAGFGHPHVRSLRRRGALTRVFPNVYVISQPPLTERQLLRAGLLAAGPDSMLGGRTAAEHRKLVAPRPHAYDILGRADGCGQTLISEVPVETTGQPAAVILRASRWSVPSEDVAGLPTCPVARVLLDLAGSEGGKTAWEAWREADYLRILDPGAIEAVCGPGRDGSALLRELAEALPLVQTAETDAQTRAEFMLVEALLARGFPRPHSNRPMQLDDRWYFPDLWWPALRAIVEIDGPVHLRPRRRADDELRDEHMAAHNISIMRVTRDAVLADPAGVAASIATWLDGLRQAHS